MIIPHDRVSPTYRADGRSDDFSGHHPSLEARLLAANIASQGIDVNRDGREGIGLQSRRAHARVGQPTGEMTSPHRRTRMDSLIIKILGRKTDDGHLRDRGKDG